MVDSADKERLNVARQELQAMLEEEELKDAILLVFANKQDQAGALGAQGVSTRVWVWVLRFGVVVRIEFGFGSLILSLTPRIAFTLFFSNVWPTLTPPSQTHTIYLLLLGE